MILLRSVGLGKRYGDRWVVRDVSLEVRGKEIVGLLGPNGAGKTTTFRMIMGLIRPDAGRIEFLGEDVTRKPVARRARAGLGYLAQEPSVFRRLSVRDNVLAVLEWIPDLDRDARLERLDRILSDLDLAPLAHRLADTLSGGERRRLEIARILVTRPRLVLLDEPFAGVDPIAVEEIQELVVHLRDQGIGVLVTDHNVRETLAITDRAYIVHDGRILQHGPADALVNDERVRRAYLGRRFVLPESARDAGGADA